MKTHTQILAVYCMLGLLGCRSELGFKVAKNEDSSPAIDEKQNEESPNQAKEEPVATDTDGGDTDEKKVADQIVNSTPKVALVPEMTAVSLESQSLVFVGQNLSSVESGEITVNSVVIPFDIVSVSDTKIVVKGSSSIALIEDQN